MTFPSLLNSSDTIFLSKYQATKIDISIPPNGNNTEAVRYSSHSKKFIENKVAFFIRPNDNEQKTPKNKTKAVTMRDEFDLLIEYRS